MQRQTFHFTLIAGGTRELFLFGISPSQVGQCLQMLSFHLILPYNAHPGLLAQPYMYW